MFSFRSICCDRLDANAGAGNAGSEAKKIKRQKAKQSLQADTSQRVANQGAEALPGNGGYEAKVRGAAGALAQYRTHTVLQEVLPMKRDWLALMLPAARACATGLGSAARAGQCVSCSDGGAARCLRHAIYLALCTVFYWEYNKAQTGSIEGRLPAMVIFSVLFCMNGVEVLFCKNGVEAFAFCTSLLHATLLSADEAVIYRCPPVSQFFLWLLMQVTEPWSPLFQESCWSSNLVTGQCKTLQEPA